MISFDVLIKNGVNVSRDPDGWQDEWPTEAGTIWLFFGSAYHDSAIGLHVVEVWRSADKNPMYVRGGAFMYKSENASGKWKKIVIDDLPKLDKFMTEQRVRDLAASFGLEVLKRDAAGHFAEFELSGNREQIMECWEEFIKADRAGTFRTSGLWQIRPIGTASTWRDDEPHHIYLSHIWRT